MEFPRRSLSAALLRYPLLPLALGTMLGARQPAGSPDWLLGAGLLVFAPGTAPLPAALGSFALGAWLGPRLGSPGEPLSTVCPPEREGVQVAARRLAAPLAGRLLAEVVAVEPAREGRTALTLELRRLEGVGPALPLRCRALLSVGRRRPEVWEGDWVWLPATDLEPPVALINPGLSGGAEALAGRGIDRVGSLPDGAAVLAFAHAAWPASAVARWRARAAQALAELSRAPTYAPADAPADAPAAEPAIQVLRALALDARAGLDRPTREAFRDSGLRHLLTLGLLYLLLWWGLTAGLVAWLWARCPPLARRWPARRAGAVAASPVAVAYGLLAADNSGQRAAGIGLWLVALTALGENRPRALHLFSLGFLVVSVAEPGAASEAAGGWSLLALVGIAEIAGPRLARPAAAGRVARILQHGEALLWVGVAALATTAPLQLSEGGPLPLAGPLLSVPGLLLAAPTVLLAQAGAVVGSGRLLALALIPARGLVGLAEFGARLGTTLWLPLSGPVLWGASALWWAALWCAARQRRPLALAFGAAGLVVVVGAVWGALVWPRAPALRITFLSVGHGDAAVVELPEGGALLIDGGGAVVGDFDPGSEVVLPFLRTRAVSSLAAVILTHPHPDHANGLPAVLRRVGVGELWTSGEPCELPACAELEALAAARGIVRRRLGGAPFRRVFGEVVVELLSPQRPQGYDPSLGPNDNSLVLRLTYRGFSALLTGDIEATAEGRLAGRLRPVTVLKAPHHGSDTSSTPGFSAALRPQAVVFSVGLRNRFGFPKASVWNRYREAGAKLWRTDLDGAVTVETDGLSAWVSTAARPEARTPLYIGGAPEGAAYPAPSGAE